MAENKDVNSQSNFGANLAANELIASATLSKIKTQMASVQTNRAYQENKWIMLERMWRGDPISRYFPGMTATNIPEPYKAIESVVPRIKKALFPRPDEWFRVIPMKSGGPGDPKTIKMMIQEQLEQGDFESRITHFIRYCAIMGTSVAKVPWVEDEYTIKCNQIIDEKDGKKIFKPTDVKIIRSRTELYNLSLFDFYTDPRYVDPMKSPFCADNTQQNKEYIYSKIGDGTYVGITREDVEQMLNKGDNNTPETLGKDLKLSSQGLNNIETNPDDNFIITEWWGLLDPENTGNREEYVVTVVNMQKVVRIQKNMLWHHRRPYVYSQWTPVDGEFYGMGLIEIIVRLCLDLNDQSAANNLATALVINPAVVVNDDANIPEEQLTMVPGKVLRTRATNVGESIRPFFLVDQTASGRMKTEEIRRDITETTGLPRSGMGGVDTQNETATAFYGRSRESNIRLEEPVRIFSKKALTPFLEMCHYNNHQFMKEERVVEVTGNAGDYSYFSITPEMLSGAAKFQVLLAPQIEMLGIRGQQMLTTVTSMTEFMPMLGNVKMDKLFRLIWADLFGHREIDDIIPPRDDETGISQDEENILMMRGLTIDVKEWHNHVAHLKNMMMFMMTPNYMNAKPEIQAIFNAHVENHNLMIKRQAEQTPPAQIPQMPGIAPMAQLPNVPDAQQMGLQLSEMNRQGVQG